MKKFFIVLAGFSLLFHGCIEVPVADHSAQKIKIVTSFYPLYEIATQVGGDNVEVKNLTPAGAEPHDYDLSPKDVASIYDAQILMVNGAGLEPWFERIAPDLKKNFLPRVLNASKLFYDLFSAHQEGFVAGNPPEAFDPHVWLDPVRYLAEVQAFVELISEVDPTHKDYYLQRAKTFSQDLLYLDESFKEGFRDCKRDRFVANHAAFTYLGSRYQLGNMSIAGLSPDAEPSAKEITQIISVLKSNNIKYILTETLVSPKIAETIARETGAQTLVLNPLEGLTSQELAEGQNYISVMRQNLKNLQIAMECKQQQQ